MINQTVGELLEGKLVLAVEGIDRLYLNACQPKLHPGYLLPPCIMRNLQFCKNP
ncbi:MAG: hypothetical protein KJ675_09315 [Gammaproteobacteria bacterium]|nr:hypothetical protein [Gammaproteobacteria bacterium]